MKKGRTSGADGQGGAKSERFRVLVVDDSELFAQAIARELRSRRIEADLAYTAGRALELCRATRYDAILLDHRLPDDDGIRIIPHVRSLQPKGALIVMTAYGQISSAIQAIRLGAEDYVLKETSIKPIIDRIREVERRRELRDSERGWDEHRKGGLTGKSPAMVAVREQIEKVAAQPDTTVLFTGETGVGKEVASRYLHAKSASPASPFLSVDCVALPATLVESLLFGHEKGSFTGAHQAKKGVFEEAENGTILLDEVGDMDLALQGKLLRVLESRRFQRVGSVQEYPVRARVIAATNRDLAQMAGEGRFRFDLYQRLAVFPIHIPSLRERAEDILLTAIHFLEFFTTKMRLPFEPLPTEVEEKLLSYDYPGNVRELKNIIERAVILAGSGRIELRHLPERMIGPRPAFLADGASPPSRGVDFIPGVDTMETLEEKLIHQALERTGGAKTEAARLLGLSRFQLLRRMQKYGMTTSGGEEDEE
ncbi:MAG: sigma-54 dependent transcriptional regulator [Deltaproteobacteria bacterium]|nr:sigma-54 dependent transcriptional regulator [Deltaproteobacteria bacterium]